MLHAESKCPVTRSKARFRSSTNVGRRAAFTAPAGMMKPNWMRVIWSCAFQEWPNAAVGGRLACYQALIFLAAQGTSQRFHALALAGVVRRL